MATEEKKFLGTAGVERLITNIRSEITAGDTKALSDAKAYADGLADNYDAAGTAKTKADAALAEAKTYADQAEADAVATAAADAAAKVKELADGQVATNKAAIGTLSELDTTEKGNLVDALNEVRGAVAAGGTAAQVTMTESTPSDASILKAYTIKQGDSTVGTINIPKDMVVQSGEVVTDPEGMDAGTYIKLVLANANNDEIYVNVGTLVDIYKPQESATQVQLAIDSATREISGTIVAGSITETELATTSVSSAKIKPYAVTSQKINDGAVIESKIKDGAVTLVKLEADVQDKIGMAHEHANAGTLSGITSAKVSAWDAAEGNAKTYADGLNGAMDTRVAAVEGKAHEHSNKALLDTYSQTEENLADAVAKKHEHSNKTVLDGITSDKVTAWDDAAGKAHEHSNKTVLDGITAAKVSAWDVAESNAIAAAATDATTKANQALADAKTYADQAEADAVSAAATDATTKANKALADAKTYADAAEADAVAAAATDATTKANAALADAKTYTDQAKADVSSEWNDALSTHTTQQASFNSGINGRVQALENISYVEITAAEIDAMFA